MAPELVSEIREFPYTHSLNVKVNGNLGDFDTKLPLIRF